MKSFRPLIWAQGAIAVLAIGVGGYVFFHQSAHQPSHSNSAKVASSSSSSQRMVKPQMMTKSDKITQLKQWITQGRRNVANLRQQHGQDMTQQYVAWLELHNNEAALTQVQLNLGIPHHPDANLKRATMMANYLYYVESTVHNTKDDTKLTKQVLNDLTSTSLSFDNRYGLFDATIANNAVHNIWPKTKQLVTKGKLSSASKVHHVNHQTASAMATTPGHLTTQPIPNNVVKTTESVREAFKAAQQTQKQHQIGTKAHPDDNQDTALAMSQWAYLQVSTMKVSKQPISQQIVDQLAAHQVYFKAGLIDKVMPQLDKNVQTAFAWYHNNRYGQILK